MIRQRATGRRPSIKWRPAREKPHRTYRRDGSVEHRRFAPPWSVSLEAQELLTTFRENTLRLLYYLAKRELGRSFESASVSTKTAPGEPKGTVLLSSIRVRANKDRVKQVRQVSLSRIASKAISWSDFERIDYIQFIYFELNEAD